MGIAVRAAGTKRFESGFGEVATSFSQPASANARRTKDDLVDFIREALLLMGESASRRKTWLTEIGGLMSGLVSRAPIRIPGVLRSRGVVRGAKRNQEPGCAGTRLLIRAFVAVQSANFDCTATTGFYSTANAYPPRRLHTDVPGFVVLARTDPFRA